MVGIIVKKYDGFNWGLGQHITSKRHLHQVMAEKGVVPYDKGAEIAKKAQQKKIKPYVQSKKAVDLINLAMSKKRAGRKRLDGVAIDEMRKMGVMSAGVDTSKFDVSKGGFA